MPEEIQEGPVLTRSSRARWGPVDDRVGRGHPVHDLRCAGRRLLQRRVVQVDATVEDTDRDTTAVPLGVGRVKSTEPISFTGRYGLLAGVAAPGGAMPAAFAPAEPASCGSGIGRCGSRSMASTSERCARAFTGVRAGRWRADSPRRSSARPDRASGGLHGRLDGGAAAGRRGEQDDDGRLLLRQGLVQTAQVLAAELGDDLVGAPAAFVKPGFFWCGVAGAATGEWRTA